jgi:ribosomal 50S subunit-recycling heat shock protein
MFSEHSMRIDKFLKNARLIKRRAVAKEACDGGRVLINGKVAKAGSEVKVGDVIQITFGIREVSVKVLELRESSRKDTAEEMYQVLD